MSYLSSFALHGDLGVSSGMHTGESCDENMYFVVHTWHHYLTVGDVLFYCVKWE